MSPLIALAVVYYLGCAVVNANRRYIMPRVYLGGKDIELEKY